MQPSNSEILHDEPSSIISIQLLLLFFLATMCLFYHIQLSFVRVESFDNKGDKKQLVWNGTSLILANKDANQLCYPNSLDIPVIYSSILFKPLPINSSDETMLMSVPGIGPGLAHEILLTREKIGRFEKLTDMLEVSGIGVKRINRLQKYFSFQ